MSEISKEDYLKELSHELHKPVKRKFPRRMVSFQYPDQVWSLDLVDMSQWEKWNKGYKWMLNCVDGFTRYAFSLPMKDKTAQTTFDTLAQIVADSGRSPKRIWCDKGGEFVNKYFAKGGYSPKKDTMYFVYSESKSCIVERFNRTLKTEMWRRGTELQTYDWVDMLGSLISWYNNRKHRTLGMSPTEASEKKNFDIVLSRVNHVVEAVPGNDNRVAKFKLGEFVRISKAKRTFHKGYEAGWSNEEFTIYSIVRPNNIEEPIVYRLKDFNGEIIDGTFYTEELQKIKNPEVYLVDKVLKEKGKKGKNKEYFVSWVGYPESANSWVKEADFTYDFSKK